MIIVILIGFGNADMQRLRFFSKYVLLVIDSIKKILNITHDFFKWNIRIQNDSSLCQLLFELCLKKLYQH